jgi:hypothetical protein
MSSSLSPSSLSHSATSPASAATSSTPGGGPASVAKAPSAKRGIGRSWKTDAQVAGSKSLQDITIRILSQFAATSLMVLNGERGVPSSLIQMENYSLPTRSERSNNLKVICSRIQDCEKAGMDIDLEYSINLIQLRLKLDLLVRKTSMVTLNQVIKDLVKDSGELAGCKESQLKHWVAWGSRLAEFSSAGEFLCCLNSSPGLMKDQ